MAIKKSAAFLKSFDESDNSEQVSLLGNPRLDFPWSRRLSLLAGIPLLAHDPYSRGFSRPA
jgi:hypothetical protein